jgi:hypothetical protein
MTPKIAQALVKSAALAEVLGITRRRVQQLAAGGVLERRPDGFVLGPSVRAYIAQRDPEGLSGEREGLIRVKRLTAELEFAVRKGAMIPLAEAVAAIGMAGSLLTNLLRGLPTRLAPVLAGREAADIEAHLAREIDATLTAYADLLERKSTKEAAAVAMDSGELLTAAQLLAAGVGMPTGNGAK